MKFFLLCPFTIGSLGDDTVHEGWSDRPLKISKLQIVLDAWPDDDLVEANMYGFAGTHRLAEAIKKNGFTGVEYDHVDVEEGDQFWIRKRKHPGEAVPELLWFKFVGRPGADDFGLVDGPAIFPLVVSERALALLKSFNFTKCEIKDFDPKVVPAKP
jgi:hypothetical protein